MKRTVSVLLAAIMLICAMPVFCFTSQAAYAAGDLIQYGNYPQTRVTDETLLSLLNAADQTWVSYDYYLGTGIPHDGDMHASDYMKYCDVMLNGTMYRGVTFSDYRPMYTYSTPSVGHSYQDDNGYYPGEIYWFCYEPIIWRVLDPASGLIITQSILDSQPFNNYSKVSDNKYYGDEHCSRFISDYAGSDIRSWLNGTFTETSFTKTQKSNIKTSALTNTSSLISAYDSADTDDQVFLLSIEEARNTEYGFLDTFDKDAARRAQGTDYAKCQGLFVYASGTYNNNSYWRLRTPYDSFNNAVAGYDGTIGKNYYTYYTVAGIRPACRLSALKTDTATFCVNKAEHTFETIVTPASLTSDGKTVRTCSVCGAALSSVINKIGAVSLSGTSFTYNGKVQKPTVKVTDSAGNTVAAANYTVTYSNASSRAAGAYTVTVTFKGDYKGSKTLTYKIAPRQVTGLKAETVKTTSIKLSWKKLSEAKAYKVEYSSDGKTWKSAAVTTNSYTLKSLKAGSKWRFRVTALDASKQVAGKKSAVLKTGTLTAAPKISKLTSAKAKTATVTWGKVTGAAKYIVYKSTDNANWKKVTVTKKLTCKLTKLSGGKKIYVKIVAINAYGKTSAASKVKSVTVKK